MNEIKLGQHWKERDTRFNRIVAVISIDHDRQKVGIATVDPLTNYTGRLTWASFKRFNGKHGGYQLVKDSA
jgi:hypothetical protein